MRQERIQAGCEGKARMTRERANVAARRQRKKGQKVHAYRCHHCKYWHVGGSDFAKPDEPQRDEMRPTPERHAKGDWSFVRLEKNGPKAVRDMNAHPIDRLQRAGIITAEQASAAYDYEALYRASLQTPQARDSTTLWEPKGHESDDGNVEAVERYRKFCREVGMIRERQMQWVCVEQNDPKPHEVGPFRETLNEVERWFGYGRKRVRFDS